MSRSLEGISDEQLNHVAATEQYHQQRSISGDKESKIRGRREHESDLKLKLDCHDDMVTVRSSTVASDSTIPVICITGLSGIGKSTLVQSLLQDQSVRKHFDNHIYWVSVSGRIDVKKRLATAIIEAIGGTVPQYYEWDPLRIHLENSIQGKKFLLILDDVCGGVDNATWDDELKLCLDAGAPESRILVTTQDNILAAKMSSSREDILHLGQLSNEDSWLLLCDIALPRSTEEQIRDFQSAGRKLVEVCQGVPFVIKTLGYFLRDKTTSEEWLNVLKSWKSRRNSVEEELLIAPPLLVSCDASTASLRECFKFCASLPNDYEIDKNNLIRWWMALGFLHNKEGDPMEMEMKGEEYFNIFVMYSFLQGYERGSVDGQKVIRYKFYRPLHALAQSQAGNESCCMEMGASFYSTMTRHLTLIFKDDYANYVSPTSDQAKKLQALKLIKSSSIWNPLTIQPDIFHQFIQLKVLDMSYTGLPDLSPKIDELSFLKYLNLSGSGISKLPDTVCNLENLETLILNDCEELTRLPQNMGNITKLRHLELKNTPALRYFPEGFGRLTDLRTLSKFIIDSPSSSSKGAKIGELKELNLLRGHLEIRGLKRVKSGVEAMEAELVKKKHLQSLCLDFEHDPSQKPETKNIREEVLEALKPFPELRNNVVVRNYLGSKYPTWSDVSTRFTSN